MLKRCAAAAMWYVAALWGWNYVSLVSGLPSSIGLPIAFCLAAYVAVDPVGRLWSGQKASAAASTFERRKAHPSPTQSV
jgi:hypothetical protein